MIVTCENCETSFQLDESRVPPQGIRVRCSRCKEAFFLAHPSSSASEAIHGAAEEAVSEGDAPGPASDLAAATAAAKGSGRHDEDEEHDWEFNVEPGRRGDVDDDSSDALGDAGGLSLDDGDDAEGSGLSLEGEEEPSIGSVAGDDSAFGSVDDYSSLMEEDASAGGSPPSEDAAGPSIASPDAGIGIGPAEGGDSEAGRYAAAGAQDDLGDPESWDFFGEGSPGDATAGGTKGSGTMLGRIALAPAGTSADDTGIGDFGTWDDDAYEEPVSGTLGGPVLRGIGLVGHAIGWSATLALVSVVVVSGFWSTAESLVRTPQELTLGPFEVRALEARWIDTARGETLLSVTGEIVSPGGNPTAVGGTVEVSLLDANGLPLEAEPRPAGVPLAAQDVRELSPGDLRIVIDRAAWQLAQERVAPGRPLAFQAVFRDVPPAAARLAVALTDGGIATNGLPAHGETTSALSLDDATALDPETAVDPATADGTGVQDGAGADGASATAPVPGEAPEERHSALPEELTWGD